MTASAITTAIDALVERKWALAPGFLTPAEARALREDAQARHRAGEFKRAGVGRSGERAERPEIRGDETLWWETAPGSPPVAPAQAVAFARLEEYREALNRELYLGLRAMELHYAHYPPGCFYLKHLDRFRDDDRRIVSVVLYLNEDWAEEDGGELVLYPPGAEPVRVLPRAGLLATFLSDDIPHEVLPNRRGRWSLTGWMGKERISR